jgi:hypothetical protein
MIGEAANQGELGLTAIGEAIRGRGHLDGVYGCSNPMVDNEPQWVWDMAERAWEASETSNLVPGATHWEAVGTYGMPWWSEEMSVVAIIGDHWFFNIKKESKP